MADGQEVPSGSTPPAGEAPKTEAQVVPLTQAMLESILDAKLRGIQSGTDKQIARTASEYRQQLESLREELGATTRGLLDASPADEDTKKVIGDRVDRERAAARQPGVLFAQRKQIVQDALAKAGLSEDDLPHSIDSYAKHPDPDMFSEAMERALKAKAKAAPPPQNDKLAALEADLAATKAEIRRLKGEDVVTDGGTGTAGSTKPVTVSDLLHNKKLMEQWDNAVKKKAASRYMGS